MIDIKTPEEIKALIKGRIEDEYRKHLLSNPDWPKIAASKLYDQWSEFFGVDELKEANETLEIRLEEKSKSASQWASKCNEQHANYLKLKAERDNLRIAIDRLTELLSQQAEKTAKVESELENALKTLRGVDKQLANARSERDKLKAEIDQLTQWKKEQILVWLKVDEFARSQTPIGTSVSEKVLSMLKERNKLKEALDGLLACMMRENRTIKETNGLCGIDPEDWNVAWRTAENALKSYNEKGGNDNG